MAIEFHCEFCGKLVRAPEEAAGKHGKCPGCQQSVYIPMPVEQVETLEIAPLDETEEQERERLRRESQELDQSLLHETDTPAGVDIGSPPAVGAAAFIEPPLDMHTLVIEYAEAMASGDLARAEEIAADIRTDLHAAQDVIQQIMSDEIPPDRLANIPRPVLTGFFRQLREGK
jgi:hypothetical protein